MSWDWDKYFILFLAISIRLWSLESSEAEVVSGTKWAVLIAGSNGYFNYRHQVYIILTFLKLLIHKINHTLFELNNFIIHK